MKYLLPFCLSVFLLLTGLRANDYTTDYASVASTIEYSFKKGDSAELSLLMAEKVELIIDSEQVNFNSISGEHAGLIMANFFKKYPPVFFGYEFEGDSSKNVKYSVASYQSSNTEFSIYLLISKTSGNRFEIETMQVREK
ncbi:DUF4783 domain-containing protein [Jiulongibacter sediminis]|jgi:hypothetical protein|uniref:DUF4783 domain-containing protein n=1 Tax=Jiulongibacter sediminis TaxID=1605367 RepID=UPI0026EF8C5C|nr:DUF4783 domain-containing protein [Jiulongibacter sediminis]